MLERKLYLKIQYQLKKSLFLFFNLNFSVFFSFSQYFSQICFISESAKDYIQIENIFLLYHLHSVFLWIYLYKGMGSVSWKTGLKYSSLGYKSMKRERFRIKINENIAV